MDELKLKFEKWFDEHMHIGSKCIADPATKRRMFCAWIAAWQASRAAIELDIDWPEANDDTWMEGEDGAYARGHEDGKDKVVIAVRQAILAAGIKVKE